MRQSSHTCTHTMSVSEVWTTIHREKAYMYEYGMRWTSLVVETKLYLHCLQAISVGGGTIITLRKIEDSGLL